MFKNKMLFYFYSFSIIFKNSRVVLFYFCFPPVEYLKQRFNLYLNIFTVTRVQESVV